MPIRRYPPLRQASNWIHPIFQRFVKDFHMNDEIALEKLKKKVWELEAALTESEEKFRLIVENTAETISIMDMNLRFVYVNPTIQTLRGFTVDEAKDQSLEEVLTPESLKYAFSIFEQEMQLEVDGTADPERTRILELEEYRKDGAVIWVEVSLSFLRDKDCKPVGILTVSRDITKRKQAEAALLKSEIKYRTLFESSADAIMIVEPPSWRFTSGNPSMVRMFRAKDETEFLSLGPWDVSPERQPDGWLSSEKALAMLEKAMQDGSFSFEWTHRRCNGEDFPATVLLTRVKVGGSAFLQGTVRDITGLKLSETYRETGREILQILNEPGNMQNCIRRVLAELKTRIGIDAVGIRLQEGDDFPYFVQEGFPNDFLLTENPLIDRDADGEVCRHPDGSARLECTCGLVISGKTDPVNPLFTQGGSFWTNDSFPLLDLSPGDDPRHHPRNQCMRHGYGSMALVPVRSKDRIVGLIQLNDRCKGRFTLESIELLEGIASHIGGAMTRKQAEEALRESEDRLRTLINATPDIVCFKDAEGRWLEANRADLELFELTGVDYSGKTDSELAGFSDFYREAFLTCEATDERTWQAQALTRGDECIPRPDGTAKVFDVIKVPLFHADGKRRGLVVLGRDITLRKRAESELQMFRETVENSSNVIGMSTPEGRHFYQNAAFDNLFGPIGDNPLSVYVDKAVAERMFKTIKAGDRWDGEVKMFSKDGSVRDILLRAYANKDGNGRITGLVGIHTDITERKRAEEERTKLEEQFHQAQKMESVGRLAGGVAHDFNNMLSVILGFTELAMKKTDPSLPFFADLAEIRKAAGRSADLTRQLLAFARKQTISPKILDLNDTVAGMINMLRRLIGEDIDLIWKPGANLWPVMMDPSQIDQVLANLCVNARDAIHDVGKITIETKNMAIDNAFCAEKPGFVPGEYLRLAVSDNGKGIDRETLGQIFEPFFTTKATGKGTGLGLATVYGIVKQNNGFIDVDSNPGQGTTFAVYLPRHSFKAGQMQKEGPAETGGRGHETILLVEDEPAILEIATQILEMHGYMVLAASAPGEAIRLAREYSGKIHLLMTDIVMPEMNGRDLAKNILSLYPDIKRLFMSGYTADVIAHHGVLEDGVHFIQKPFTINGLVATVRKALGG